jgi:hypothetical protein
VLARFGNGEARAEVVMPRGGEELQLILKRDTGYNYIVGFRPGSAFGGDTSFRPYYLVKGSRHEIQIKALKSYNLD